MTDQQKLDFKERLKKVRVRMPWHYRVLVNAKYPHIDTNKLSNVKRGFSFDFEILEILEEIFIK